MMCVLGLLGPSCWLCVDGREGLGVSPLADSMADCVPGWLCGDRGLSVSPVLCCRWLVFAEGSGFSVRPHSGQVYLLALAKAVCLVFGFLHTQYTSDIPRGLVDCVSCVVRPRCRCSSFLMKPSEQPVGFSLVWWLF